MPEERRPENPKSPVTHPVVAEELAHLNRIRTHLIDAARSPMEGEEGEVWDAPAGRNGGSGSGSGGNGGGAGSGSGAGGFGGGKGDPRAAAEGARPTGQLRFDDDLIELRDEVAEAKAEDVAPLAEQMMRVAAIRAARGQGGRMEAPADPESPYFGHLRLMEGRQQRDIFIGKRTYINTRAGVVIVDWRNAPISSLYYRYDEGDDYDEEIAGRQREGLVTARRTLSVVGGDLVRVRAPQGVFVREGDGPFRQLEEDLSRLKGGQGTALRPKAPAFVSRRAAEARARVGQAGRPGLRPDKHLPEISALLDAEQFRLITSGEQGLVVITGGAGSGKTTIGLHRIAFLAFQQPKRYRPERMLVVVPAKALQSYVSRVLPDLGLPGVPVRTLHAWLRKQRQRTLRRLAVESLPETLDAVRRVKKHPGMLALVDAFVEEQRERARVSIFAAVAGLERGELLADAWARLQPAPLALQLRGLLEWCRQPVRGEGGRLPGRTLAAVEAAVNRVAPRPGDLVHHWADLVTDRDRLAGLLASGFEPPTGGDLSEAVQHCAKQTAAVLELLELREHSEGDERPGDEEEERQPLVEGDDGSVLPYLSAEDDALLLRLFQRLCGSLAGSSGKRLAYAHLLVDEVQDLSAVELAVLLGCVAPDGSVTLAGDPAQRMVFDTGYRDWPELLSALGLSGVAIEPLRIGYRSTAEIQRFAQLVLGPEWQDRAPRASRPGVPVEAFHFGDPGEAVVFLADALRELTTEEPLASVALIARYPAQADTYYRALRTAEVPGLRRVVEQDFSFAPGIEITDVRQVKGLEFDYVLLLDVTAESYPDAAEARHLIHIAATRAAHQLWLIVPGRPSPVLEEIGRP